MGGSGMLPFPGVLEGALGLLGSLEVGGLLTPNCSKGVLLNPPELCCALCREHPHLCSLCWHLLS